MGFEIFLAAVPDEEATFERVIVERAFASLAADLDGDYWNLQSPEGEPCAGAVYIKDKPLINSICVTRPPGFPEFWDAVYEVLRQTRTILFWPGDWKNPVYCFANPDVVPLLPGFREEWAELPQVSSGAEIIAAIERT